ncbi:thioredoxin-like [Algibacter lectus]|uniref:Thioredoxin-like n=1 Tax=Algibacter lectus TaxID=221126 RepID=A0A090X015_9FLAO|nr:TlpA disulfide reductase family protein [Algibacter lectus]GAL82740.1 thioredoxin-like [Algibacter lectus]
MIVQDYVTLAGTITNQNSDSLWIRSRGYKKIIKVNEDGTFMDTLKVEKGSYRLLDGKEGGTTLYLKNGFDLKLSLDTKEFDETIIYDGIGAEANNYLAKKALLNEKEVNLKEFMSLDRVSFDEKLNTVNSKFKSLLGSTKNLDSAFLANEENVIEKMSNQLMVMFERKQALLAMNGQASPKFVDYENHAGGNTSLDDLKGKYVYIDMWATWCAPCKREIPFLKEVEKAYHDKNIEFVSISVDRKKDYEAWKTMVDDKELGGIQLYSNRDINFSKAYKVSAIPRFILIGPEGDVVASEAPRPSDDKLKELFKSLNI